jgi:hypothetical protein
LHVLQPIARTWGRIRGRELPRRDSPSLDWTGDRWHWLGALESELRRQGCHVSSDDPSDRSDFEVRRGPLARAHVTTAVMWNWSPQASIRVRPSLPAWCALGIGLIASFVAAPWALLATIAIGGAVAWSMVSLQRRVKRAVAHTTRGAAV